MGWDEDAHTPGYLVKILLLVRTRYVQLIYFSYRIHTVETNTVTISYIHGGNL